MPPSCTFELHPQCRLRFRGTMGFDTEHVPETGHITAKNPAGPARRHRSMTMSPDTASQSDPIAGAYRYPADDVVAALQTDARRGLSAAEAHARLSRYGKNELASEKPIPAWKKFLAQFKDMLVILLLVA